MNWVHLSKLSIRQRLPLLICVLLILVIAVFSITSYLVVRKAALTVGQERLQTLSHQLTSMLAANTSIMLSSTGKAANDPQLEKFLLSGGKHSVGLADSLLRELQQDSSFVQADILDRHGLVLWQLSETGSKIPSPITASLPSDGTKDSVKIGAIGIFNESVCYPVIARVSRDTQLLGYLVRWRMIRAKTRSMQQITHLMGSDARLYLGNMDGSVWTDMIKQVPPLPVQQDQQRVIEYNSAQNGSMLASFKRIPNTQWVVAIEFPKSKILDAASRSLFWIAIIAPFILAVGVLITWLLSRNITRPLKNLTDAASAIAAGNYSPVVQVHRYDELGKLARAFSAMTSQVKNAQDKLQNEAANYKLLFEHNPMPMWIIRRSDFSILDVNNAAADHYGYTKEEFMTLNATDLRPTEEVGKYLRYVLSNQKDSRAGIWKHKTKQGTIIMVEIIAENIIYRGTEARMVLAHDVTEKLKLESQLVQQQISRQEIITETTIHAQEKEREEIGKELHDNINQILASSKLYLELVRSGGDEALLNWSIEKAYENVNLAISEIRALSKQLVPPSLDSTLLETIKGLAGEIQATTSLQIILSAQKFDESLLTGNYQLMIYRIVQEQVNNIIKHASAQQVKIHLQTSPGNVTVNIVDDGVGFDTSQKSKGIGLRNIVNRVKFYKGTVNIFSQKGEGCRLDVNIPLIEEEDINTNLIAVSSWQ